MNDTEPLENPETQNQPPHPSLSPKATNRQLYRQTSMVQCVSSTQVNMSEEVLNENMNTSYRKNKKKEYKKRKKEKKRIEEKSAKLFLAQIIQKIYAGERSLQDERQNIQMCLQHLVTGNKFHDFLNQTIKFHVNTIQRNIYDQMQKLLTQNFPQNSQENDEFYFFMIEKIYQEYLNIKRSSRQIEDIIKIFIKITSGTYPEENQVHELGKNTFKYLIQTDETIHSITKIFFEKVPMQEYEHLREMYELMMIEGDIYYEEEESYIQESTEADDDDKIQNQVLLKPKKKKKKFKESEFSPNLEIIIKRLDGLKINEKERIQVNTSQKWLQSLKTRVLSERDDVC